MKKVITKGPFCKYHNVWGHHTNDCIALCNNVEAEARKGTLGTILSPIGESSKPAIDIELALKWQAEEMQRLNKGKDPECNVILQETDAPTCSYTDPDVIDPMEFHRKVLQEQGLLPDDDAP